MKAFLLSLLLFASVAQAQNTDFTVGTAGIIDLTDQSGTTNWQLGDDAISSTINLDFSFDFYGETFTSGKGATNGCWTFTGYNNTCSDYTPDPLPQSGMDMTIFPLWGDWIRDSGSKMLYKTFGNTADTDQYFVLGWYDMREFNRSSNNTFEMLLYEGTNKVEFRYGDLNIIKHDIVVGVQGHATASSHAMYNVNEYKVYLHHNECASGTQHDSYDTNCVNTDWNNTSHNTAIENKSLSLVVEDQYGCASNALLAATCYGYAPAYFSQQCNISALYDSECTGYAAAYLAQQCDITALYSSECSGYVVAYFNQQCGLNTLYNRDCIGYDDAFYDRECAQNSQYDTGCAGYIFETVYYYDEYEQYNDYDEFFDDDPYANMEFTDEEWYEIDLEEFGQEQVDEWYGAEVSFDVEGLMVWEDSALTNWDELDMQMDEYDEFVEIYEDNYYEEVYYEEEPLVYEEEFIELVYVEEEVFLFEEFYEEPLEVVFEYQTFEYETPLLEDVLTQNFENEQIVDVFYEEEPEFLEFEMMEYETPLLEDVLMQNFEHEQIVEVFYEEEPEFLEFETIEELEEWFEDEQTEEEELVEELVEEEMDEDSDLEDSESFAEEREDSEISLVEEDDKGDKKEMQLNVVASTIQAATNSVSGTTSGTSIQSTGNSVASGGVSSTTSTAVASSASGGGMSTSSSPSISAQFTSATAQTQTLLDMSSVASTGGSMSTEMSSFDSGITSVASVDTSFSSDTTSFDSGTTSIASADTSVSADVVSVESSVSIDTSSAVASADNAAVGNTSGDNNTVVGNTSGDNNTAIGNDTTAASETSTNTEVASNTTGGQNTAVGNTTGDNNTAVGNTTGGQNTVVGSMETEIATAMGEVSASEADQIADQIVAQNIEDQQEQLEEQQQETGEYGDEAQLIAYMGFVPGFDDYKQVTLADASAWYAPKTIYGNVSISDNNSAFIGLYGNSLTGMKNLINMQPKL